MLISSTVGYGILIGIGLLFALIVSLIIKAETKWLGTKKTSEWFSTAGRNVKTGLLSSSIVSAWVWAATLLQSSTVAYKYGISGPFWYAAGATIPLIFFSVLAMQLKLKTPSVSTFPQIIYQRYGRQSHKVFLSFAFMTNTIVTSMLVLGGAWAVHEITGVDIWLASLLIPVGIVIYTFFGGLRATFLADYLNVILLFVGALIFVSIIYFASPQIGGISGMYEKLQHAATLRSVDGNTMGSFLTMASIGGIIFGVINIVGNLGTVFVDQSYWQRAIAAKGKVAGRAFIGGGLIWFAIPFGIASTLGLAAVGLNLTVTPDELNSGLVAPLAALKTLDEFGGILILAMIITAVTSAGSAQLIAASTLVTHDVYKTYKNPNATSSQLYSFTRKSVLVFGAMMGFLGIILFQMHLSLQYLYLVMGVIIGSAVGPIALALLWSKTNRYAATTGAIVGLVAGVTSWLYMSLSLYGAITLATTANDMPLLIGNIVSITTGLFITVIGSIIKKEKFIFKPEILENEIKEILLEYRQIKKYALVIPTILVIVWPLPLYFSGFVFSEITFHYWIIMMIAWVVCGAFIGIGFPLIESKSGIVKVIKNSVIALVFTGIVSLALFSYSFISASSAKDQYVDFFIYGMIGILASFGLILVILNKRLQKLVDIKTAELTLERNNLSDLVQQKTNELLKKEKLATIGNLSARIAHDLRNPLSVLQGTLGMLQLRHKNLDEKTLEQYDRMDRAIERIAHQVEDVLDYVRTGKLKTETCALDELTKYVIEKLNIPKTIETRVNVGDIKIDCDRIKIEAMLSNLILNAIQAIDENGIIRVRALERGKDVIIEIEDSGPEIPDDVLKQFFVPLFTTKQRGTGLGLASCKSIVEQHGGQISVTTSPTVIMVVLPKWQNSTEDHIHHKRN